MDKISRLLFQLMLFLNITLYALPASAFSYINRYKAHLDVSSKKPEAVFYLSHNLPSLIDKDKVANGKFTALADEAYWPELIKASMKIWNDIPSSYVKLVLADVRKSEISSIDEINVIVSGNLGALAAASAAPSFDSTQQKIIDCDITIPTDSRQSAQELWYSLTHEFGHCLGLGHDHISYTSIMSYSNENRDEPKLTFDDMAGITALYPSDNNSPKETIACGVIASGVANSGQNTNMPLLAMLFMPAILSLFLLKNNKKENKN